MSRARREITALHSRNGDRERRRAHRIADLYTSDPQFRRAEPIAAVTAAARRPGLRLAQVFQTIVDGYAERPALGHRVRALTTNPATGRTTARLLPAFQTISYRDLWTRVGAVATGLRTHPTHPVSPGDFVATLGFGSPDYVTVDLAATYLGLVSVPLQHNASVSQLKQIIAEAEPRVIAVGAAYLDLAVESAASSTSLRHLLVFDYQPEINDHHENFDRARRFFDEAGMPVSVETLAEVVQRGNALPPEPIYIAGTDDRLAMIFYTSGSTGLPKGVMYTERMVSKLWTVAFMSDCDAPVFNVNFMPLNHSGGRLTLAASFCAGGTSYFVAEPDLSTLFEDWTLVRPTEMVMVPRVVDMLFQRYRSTVDRYSGQGIEPVVAEEQAAAELREQLLGGRVISGFVGSAPLSAEMASFIKSCLDTHVLEGYGATEVGSITRDGTVMRSLVIDYKLIDVPELGYFTTDQPHPRGELLVKSVTATPGYYKRPEVTAEVFDANGYYHTGDVVAELGLDRLVCVDRRKNVLKLAQGEFVALANLEAVFARAPLVRQIFVYGNSERHYLLAVIVPTAAALKTFGGDTGALKTALSESLQQTRKFAELQPYEVPIDFLIESEPFSANNGFLSAVGKLLRPKLQDHYGERLEQLYADLAAAQADQLRELRHQAADRPMVDTLIAAAGALLGSAHEHIDGDTCFMDLSGDSLSALTFSNLLQEIFGIEVPVGVIIGPAANLRQLAHYIEAGRRSESRRPTSATVHGRGATELNAADLTLDKFIDATTLADAATLAHTTGDPRTVLLTGANGYLGRFLCLDWLQRLSENGGKLICLVRGNDAAAAKRRLLCAFDAGDPDLLRHFHDLSVGHLEVLAGDIAEPTLGLNGPTWNRLANTVDCIVHPAALVNHVLPYAQLFGPNVVGTAELIRLAITARIKPINYVSTVRSAMSFAPDDFVGNGDIRVINGVRPIDNTYANGYSNSKWAGEVLLREAHDLCALPVAVFRSGMILAHTRYVGQLNPSDAFTRLIVSLLATGIAPKSFYETDDHGDRAKAHYVGLPVDLIAASIAALGAQIGQGFHPFDVINPYDDGVSLDTFVDWLIDEGRKIHRIDDYKNWLARFENALRALPEKQRQHTVLPLLDAYRQPQQLISGAVAPSGAFHAAARAAKIGTNKDTPHLTQQLLSKYVTDLQRLGLLFD